MKSLNEHSRERACPFSVLEQFLGTVEEIEFYSDKRTDKALDTIEKHLAKIEELVPMLREQIIEARGA